MAPRQTCIRNPKTARISRDGSDTLRRENRLDHGARGDWRVRCSARSPNAGPVVIVDSDGPVANADASARLRAQALARGRTLRPGRLLRADGGRHHRRRRRRRRELSRRDLRFPDADLCRRLAELRCGHDILRKNEAVRDAVIAGVPRGSAATRVRRSGSRRRDHARRRDRGREQPQASAPCGHGDVAARATIVSSLPRAGPTSTSRASGSPTPSGRGSNSRRPAGGPARAVDSSTTQGCVHDATETVASRLSATFVALNDQRDVDRARQALVDAEQPAPVTSADIAGVPPTAPEPSPPTDVSTVPPRSRSRSQR